VNPGEQENLEHPQASLISLGLSDLTLQLTDVIRRRQQRPHHALLLPGVNPASQPRRLV
jgi:hypothetical protein